MSRCFVEPPPWKRNTGFISTSYPIDELPKIELSKSEVEELYRKMGESTTKFQKTRTFLESPTIEEILGIKD